MNRPIKSKAKCPLCSGSMQWKNGDVEFPVKVGSVVVPELDYKECEQCYEKVFSYQVQARIDSVLSKNAIYEEEVTEKDLVPGYKFIVKCDGYMGGRPALLGKRMSVRQILENLASGMTREDFVDLFEIQPEVISEVLFFAAEFAGGKD